eukprot:14323975-Alexandrium_andersonii.AAC.1
MPGCSEAEPWAGAPLGSRPRRSSKAPCTRFGSSCAGAPETSTPKSAASARRRGSALGTSMRGPISATAAS